MKPKAKKVRCQNCGCILLFTNAVLGDQDFILNKYEEEGHIKYNFKKGYLCKPCYSRSKADKLLIDKSLK